MSNRVLYLGNSAAMDANDMIGFAPTEIADLLMALNRAAEQGMPSAGALRSKIVRARDRRVPAALRGIDPDDMYGVEI